MNKAPKEKYVCLDKMKKIQCQRVYQKRNICGGCRRDMVGKNPPEDGGHGAASPGVPWVWRRRQKNRQEV